MRDLTVELAESALKARAKKGRETPDARRLSELELVQRERRDGEDLLGGVDRVLLDVIHEIPTDGFERADGKFRRTPEAVRCFLGMFCRLDLERAVGVERGLDMDRLFPPDLEDGERHPVEERYARVRAYDRFGGYPRDAMCAALSCGPKGAVNHHLKSARELIARAIVQCEEELMHRSANQRRKSSAQQGVSIASTVQEAELKLRESGLLVSYVETLPVKRLVDALIDKLEEPLRTYADAGANFDFVVHQLEEAKATLQGICVSDDLPVNGNDEYVQKQFVALEGGIDIERIFLYTEQDREKMVQAAKKQKSRAAAARKRALARDGSPGTYTPYLLDRSCIEAEDPDEESVSIAIIDGELPTRRVIRQRFSSHGSLNHREVTVSGHNVERAIELFDTLKQNSMRI